MNTADEPPRIGGVSVRSWPSSCFPRRRPEVTCAWTGSPAGGGRGPGRGRGPDRGRPRASCRPTRRTCTGDNQMRRPGRSGRGRSGHQAPPGQARDPRGHASDESQRLSRDPAYWPMPRQALTPCHSLPETGPGPATGETPQTEYLHVTAISPARPIPRITCRSGATTGPVQDGSPACRTAVHARYLNHASSLCAAA